jgi:acyl-CoA synthetase (AMP-forming)/AMP-acid ligase II
MDTKSITIFATGLAVGVAATAIMMTNNQQQPSTTNNNDTKPSTPTTTTTNKPPPSPTTTIGAIPPSQTHRTITIPQMLCRTEQVFGHELATISATGVQMTYKQLITRIRKAASGLINNLGLQKGDRVGILSLNTVEYLELLFAISFAGGLPVPLNIRHTPQEIADCLNDCEAKVLVVDETFSNVGLTLKTLVKSLQHIIWTGTDVKSKSSSTTNTGESLVMYETLIETSPPSREIPIEYKSTDIYGIFYTGGTTGKSKGVMLSHEGLIFNAYSIVNVVNYVKGIRYLHAGPMFHLADGASTFGVTMMGGVHVFIPRFVPDLALRAIHDHKVTHTLWVPSMFMMVLQVPNLKDFDVSSMLKFIYGASPMPEATLLSSMKTFPNAKFVHGYGMSESSPCLTFCGPENHYAGSPLLASCGQVVPHCELKIVNEKDIEVPRGEVGEIVVRGPNVMLGYWNMPERSAEALRNGWLHTGDGGLMNNEGYVFIKDRIKDMIVSGGENVYSSEVENCVLQMPEIKQCAVIGIPDSVLVEKVCAIVVLKDNSKKPSVTAQQIIDHCKKLIAGYKCPKEIVFRNEDLPLSGAGKVLKSVLRKPYWEKVKSEIYSTTDDRKTTYT